MEKKYGGGWGFPLTWQGWVIDIIFLAIYIWNAVVFFGDLPYSINPAATIRFVLITLIATGVLIWITYKKGEPTTLKIDWEAVKRDREAQKK